MTLPRIGIKKPRRPEEVVPITPELPAIDEDALLQSVDTLYPEIAQRARSPVDVLREVRDFATVDPDAFLADIKTKGRTRDIEIMLQGFGFKGEEIDEVFPDEELTLQDFGFPEWMFSDEIPKAKSTFTRTLETFWGKELVLEVSTSLGKPYAAVRNPDVEAYIVAHPEIEERIVERQQRLPAATLAEEASIFGRGLLKLPRQLGASILQAAQGFGGASVVDPDWADRFIESANTDFEKFVSDISEEYKGRPTLFGMPLEDLASFSQSLAFSLTSMGAGLGTGLPIAAIPIPGSRVAAWAAGTAASGAVAYNITVYQITQQYLEIKNDEMIAERGRGLTQAEETKLKDEFASLARKYGLWEAIPEAVSNLAFVGILTAPLTKMIGVGVARSILTKIALMYGQELLTETITQKGQSGVEIEAGMREGKITWMEAFREIAPQTFLLTTIMAGAGQVIISSKNALTKTEESLKEEIGEDHSLFKEFIEKIRKGFAEAIRDERGGIGREEEVAPEGLTPEQLAEREARPAVDRFQAELTGRIAKGQAEIPTQPVPEAGVEVLDKTGAPIEGLQGQPIALNADGTITLFHRTTPEIAEEIRRTGIFKTPTPAEEVFFSNLREGQAEGYGEAVVEIRLKPGDVSLDDAFPSGEVHVSVIPLDIVSKGVVVSEAPTPLAVEAVAEVPAEERIETLKTKPLEPKEDVGVEVFRQQEIVQGQPKLTIKQIDALTGFFADYIDNPSTVSAWEITRELRRETRAGRAEELKHRTEVLMVEEGLGYEQAIDRAMKETLSGELPRLTSVYLAGMTAELRDALFGKVYHVLKDEPLEMASTVTALVNALAGKPIPREPGVRGGSAYTRLQRVFGDQPKVLVAIDKAASEHKPLKDIIEGIFRETGRDPIPIDQETAEYLRNLKNIPFGQAYLSGDVGSLKKLTDPKTPEQIAQETLELDLELAPPPQPPTRYDLPISDAFKELPLWPEPFKAQVVRVLKEIGMSPVDIGNFLRANKASFDFSFWRQQAPLIASHPVAFAHANLIAWNATWSQKAADAAWARITRKPLYEIYTIGAEVGGDFLRPHVIEKGMATYRGTEEFGYGKGVERVIPKITQWLPWVKLSQRGFEAGTNEHNWLIYEAYYKAMLRIGEDYAVGKRYFKPGEVWDIEKEMVDFSKMLANFTARGSLGSFSAAAPALSGLFFAPRASIGRVLSVKDLLNANPRVRREAWKNAALFVSILGGIILMGAYAGWWSVEKDPRNAEYMSIRLGNTRIDPWGGYRQFLVFFARAFTKTGVSSVTGAEYTADPINLLQTLIRGKASPLASTILDFWRGKNFIGEDVDVANKEQWAERIAPFSIWDIYEAYKDDPITALEVAIPAMLGAGVQTYTGDWREDFAKLGLSKYSENLGWGLNEPVYDTGDLWSDTSSRFAGVDPTTLTEQKGFPEYIRAITRAREIKDHLATLPNDELVGINADPNKGITYVGYYEMWRGRERIVATGDEDALKEFDEQNKRVYLGNFSQRQFALLNEYWSITDKEKQADFLKLHEDDLDTNIRKEYLRTRPGANADLAIWQQAKVESIEAYNQTKTLGIKLDIPDNAFMNYLPSEEVVEVYFKLSDSRRSDVLKSGTTKEIAELYLEYSEIYSSGEKGAQTKARDFRKANDILQQWGEINLGWKPLSGTTTTPETTAPETTAPDIRQFEGLLR